MRTDRQKIFFSCLLLALLTAAVFLPSLANDFVAWDDPLYLLDNLRIRDLSLSGVATLFTTLHVQAYKPLTELSFALEYHFFGLAPLVYHLDNLILHVFNSLLAFWLFFLLRRSFGIAFLTALLFAVHPLRVESVVWVTERKDVLYGCFFLGSLIAYLRYLDRRRRKYYLLALLLFTLSLLPKAQGVALPGLLLLLDYLRGRRITGEVLREKVPFLLVSALFFLINAFGQVSGDNWDANLFRRIIPNLLNAAYALVFYLVKLILPVRLSVFYPFPDPESWGAFCLFTLAPAILATLALVVIYSARYTRKLVFAALFFLINLAVILQVVRTPNPWVVSDRYTYIAVLGINFLAAAGFLRLGEKFRRRRGRWFLIPLPGAAALLFFLALTSARTRIWRDSLTLWDDVLEKYPALWQPHMNRGMALLDRGETAMAEAAFREAERRNPDFWEAHSNLAGILIGEGRLDEAAFHLDRAFQANPDAAEAYHNLGYYLVRRGRPEEATEYFLRALRRKPHFPAPHYNLARIFLERGDLDGAIYHARKFLRFKPRHPEMLNTLGIALSRQGRSEEAVACFREVILLAPSHAEAHNNLGIELAGQNRIEEAAASFREALRIKPDYLGAAGNLELLRSLRPGDRGEGGNE